MSETAAAVASIDGRVGTIELHRPAKFNCISSDLLADVEAALDRFEADDTVRCILLTGAGKVFCTGADLDEILAAADSAEGQAGFVARIHAVLRRLEASPLPVVAAVHGLVLAGGLEIMLACDVVLAAQSARIGDQHARYGLVPGGGGTQRLARLVGLRRALDLMFTARWLDAAEAERWGLVNYVVPDDELLDRAMEYCRTLSAKSRPGLALMKRLSRQGLEGSLSAGLTLEEVAVGHALSSADAREGLAAFQARREPDFS